jgi:quercetin dioxygenase-like cupin family protein
MTESRTVYQWTDFPQVDLFENTRKRSAMRSDGAMVVFNWTKLDMPRLPSDSHPFDQTVVTFRGRQMLEVEGWSMELGPGTIVRIPADARHNSWPIGDESTMHLDIYAPARPDYHFLVEHQTGFAPLVPGSTSPTIKTPRSLEPTIYRFADLPVKMPGKGVTTRSGFRGDDFLMTFNHFEAGMPRPEPHWHPFDQIILVVEGRMMVEIDGVTAEMDPGTAVHVPPSAKHTAWPIGDAPAFNIDVFGPPRADYLPLTEYQTEFGRS